MYQPKISQQDEYLLSRLLDGDLPADQADKLCRRMESEPNLRAAHKKMERLNQLLTARRDDQPTIDWGRFRRKVMDRVETEAPLGGRVIPFPNWLKIGAPLAAAASVVLILTAYSILTGPATKESAVPGPITVTVNTPTDQSLQSPDSSLPMVTYHRFQPTEKEAPATPKALASADRKMEETGGIGVKYRQSPELAEAIERADKMRENAPSLRRFRASVKEKQQAPPPSLPDEIFLEAPSL